MLRVDREDIRQEAILARLMRGAPAIDPTTGIVPWKDWAAAHMRLYRAEARQGRMVKRIKDAAGRMVRS